jgi:hypothetical protein
VQRRTREEVKSRSGARRARATDASPPRLDRRLSSSSHLRFRSRSSPRHGGLLGSNCKLGINTVIGADYSRCACSSERHHSSPRRVHQLDAHERVRLTYLHGTSSLLTDNISSAEGKAAFEPFKLAAAAFARYQDRTLDLQSVFTAGMLRLSRAPNAAELALMYVERFASHFCTKQTASGPSLSTHDGSTHTTSSRRRFPPSTTSSWTSNARTRFTLRVSQQR